MSKVDNEQFVNLHLHTKKSLLDALSKTEDVMQKVATLKQPAVAITEHGNVFSAVEAHKEAKKYGVKHIYGMEAYITEDRFIKDSTRKYYHLTILAKNEKGRINLNKLATLGYSEGFYYKPRIDHELLKIYGEGLIVLSGCLAGELQRAITGGRYDEEGFEILQDDIDRAKAVVKNYQSIMGKNYFLEVQAHKDSRQQKVNRVVQELGYEFDIPVVATTDSHYTEEDDKELHGIFIEIGTNREAGETYDDCFIMSAQQVYDRLPSFTHEERLKAIRQSLVIADMCNVSIPLSTAIIPHVDIPSNFKSEAEYLKHMINRGWKKRQINSRPNVQEYKERLMYEYNAIEKMGFIGYFLYVESYANSVERKGIARGSAGGSLISYLLEITELDPIPYGLYFERFIDVSALDMLADGIITKKELKIPDIDLDFSKTERDNVERYIIEKYGQEKYASLGQFGVIWDKTAIADVGRVLNIPYTTINRIRKDLGDSTIEYALETGALKEHVENYPKLFHYAKQLVGVPKSFGIHPCARVVFNNDVEYHMPTTINNGTVVVQGDMNDAEDVGATKSDILGLVSLDTIYDTLELISEDYEYIRPDKMDFSDEKVLNVFRNGDTAGVFQFESNGMRETLRQINPDGIEDLAVANALFRPASMKFIEHYAKRKNGEEEYEFLHDSLSSILKVTYGIMVFQEQLIEIGRMAGLRNPDLLRKATGKKDLELMKKVKPELFEGLSKLGWTEDSLEELWQIMIDFASYSFNKSHAVAYAILAFQMGKLKAYHPKEFMTSLMTSKLSKNKELAMYLMETKEMGIELNLPDLNNPEDRFILDKEGKINIPLTAITGIGSPTVTKLKKGLERHGSFKSLEDYIEKAKVIENKKDKIKDDIKNAKDEEVIEKLTKQLEEVQEQSFLIDVSALVNLAKVGSFGEDRNGSILRIFEALYVPTKWKDSTASPAYSVYNGRVESLIVLRNKMEEGTKEWKKLNSFINKVSYSKESYPKDKEMRSKLYNDVRRAIYEIEESQRREKHREEFLGKYVKDESMYDFETMKCFINKSPFSNIESSIKNFYEREDDGKAKLLVGTVLENKIKRTSRKTNYAELSIITPYGVVYGKAYSEELGMYKTMLEEGMNIVALVKKNGREFVIKKMKNFDKWKAKLLENRNKKENK